MIERTNGWDWGDAPTWVASFAGLAALVVASYAAAKTRAMLKIESNRDKAASERDERAQADLVAAWLDKDVTGEAVFPWHIHIANASLVPVYALRVAVIFKSSSEVEGKYIFGRSFPVVPPGERKSSIKKLIGLMVDSMPIPEDETPYELSRYGKSKDLVIAACGIWIMFRDASGNHWTRSDEGKLCPGPSGPFAAVQPAPSVEE